MLLELTKKPFDLFSALVLVFLLFVSMPVGAYGANASPQGYSKVEITYSTMDAPPAMAVQEASSESEGSVTDLLPPFIKNMLWWSGYMVFWVLIGFGAVFALGLLLTGLSEAYWIDGLRRDLLDHPDEGRSTVWKAMKLGFASAPSRRRIFAQAKELLAEGVSRAGILAYLFSSQSICIFILIFIMELIGVQLALGQLVAAGAGILILAWGVNRMPDDLWEKARTRARESFNSEYRDLLFTQKEGAGKQRIWTSIKGQLYSLWAPLLYGFLGLGFFLALGFSDAAFSFWDSRGALSQIGNAVLGLTFAYVLGAPLVGNVLVAAGLWKGLFLTYAGISAFYLGPILMPYSIHRYFDLFGRKLAYRIILWLVIAILVGALAATAWWWGLDWLGGVLGFREWFETFTGSTLRPNDVPWFLYLLK